MNCRSSLRGLGLSRGLQLSADSFYSLLCWRARRNKRELRICCYCSCYWLLLLNLRDLITPFRFSVDHAPVHFPKFSRCATYRQEFRESRQIATEEHKKWPACVLQEDTVVLARTPPLCVHEETYLVPAGGLFTVLTLTSAKSPALSGEGRPERRSMAVLLIV